MSNYRVRQIMHLTKRHPEAQRDLLIGLATWLDDDTIEARVSADALAEASALHPDTIKDAKRALRARGDLEFEPGKGRGHVTLYRVLILKRGVRSQGHSQVTQRD